MRAPDPQEQAPEGRRDASEHGSAVLGDLPPALWGPLLRAFRRAVETIPRSDLPTALRPFVGWKPERLVAEHPRRALVEAMAGDERLREAVGTALLGPDDLAAVAEVDTGRLVQLRGEEEAAAVLAVQARWEDLAALAASSAERRAARQQAAAEDERRRQVDQREGERQRLASELAEVRSERERLRRRAEQAEQRAAAAASERDGLKEEVASLRTDAERLAATLDRERSRFRDRLERLRRRAEAAESRLRVDDDRAREVADELEGLAGDLRAALRPGGAEPGPPSEHVVTPATVPREVASAEAGRPCRLPPGLDPGSPEALVALLKVRGLEVVVDGYNVTMHTRGKPLASLENQRLWLIRLAEGLAARYRRMVTVVFDSEHDRPGRAPASRGVRVVFSEADESADDRIVDHVASMHPDDPVVVITGDRDLGERCADLGADVMPSAALLAAVGG